MVLLAMTLGWLLPGAVLFVFLRRKENRLLSPGTSLEDGGWVILARMAGTIMASTLTLAMAAALLAETSRPRAVVQS